MKNDLAVAQLGLLNSYGNGKMWKIIFNAICYLHHHLVILVNRSFSMNNRGFHDCFPTA